MFASKDVRDKREADAAAEWVKAKAALRSFRRWLAWLALIVLFTFVYFAGERSGFIACRQGRLTDSTPG